MGDYNFIRYYISAQNGWNPFDESVKKIPSIYWLMSFHMKRMNDHIDYENNGKQVAELNASIVAPSNYSEYAKYIENEKKGGDRTIKDNKGERGSGTSDAHFDLEKGLIDSNGNVIVSIDVMRKHNPESEGIFTG